MPGAPPRPLREHGEWATWAMSLGIKEKNVLVVDYSLSEAEISDLRKVSRKFKQRAYSAHARAKKARNKPKDPPPQPDNPTDAPPPPPKPGAPALALPVPDTPSNMAVSRTADGGTITLMPVSTQQ